MTDSTVAHPCRIRVRTSYAGMVSQDVLWPDFDRHDLWRAGVQYAPRNRRFGGAIPNDAGS